MSPATLMRHIYFPTDSIVSLLYVLESGASAEIAVVGNDGAVGVSLFMGGETTTTRAVVQSAGSAYRLSGARLKREFYRHGELHARPAPVHAVADHPDGADGGVQPPSFRRPAAVPLAAAVAGPALVNELVMTHELIANMLGVRREGVTDAAGKLQKHGVIRYSRGHITVLDRPKLEKLCCECYGVVKKETDRLLPGVVGVR